MKLLTLPIKIAGISLSLSYIWFDGYDMLDKSAKTSTQWIIIKLPYLFSSGVVPSKTPFGLHSVILGHYFSGAHYIRGGPSELAFQMIQVIEEKDGRVLVNAPVSEILMSEKGRAVGQSWRGQCTFVILRFKSTSMQWLFVVVVIQLYNFLFFAKCEQLHSSDISYISIFKRKIIQKCKKAIVWYHHLFIFESFNIPYMFCAVHYRFYLLVTL